MALGPKTAHWTPALIRMHTTAMVLMATALAGCYNNASEFQALAERSVPIEGTVYSLNCNNHGQYWYEFYFNGKRHIGTNEPNAPKHCTDVSVGAKVTVHVDPKNPDVHTLATPSVAYESRRGFYVPTWAIIVIGGPLIIAFQVWQAVRRSK